MGPHHSLNTSLLYRQIFQAPFALSLPQTQNQPFVQGGLILFSREWYVEAMVWAPGVLTTAGVSCHLHVGCFSTPSCQLLCLLNGEQFSLLLDCMSIK